jgi:hypothetical protein
MGTRFGVRKQNSCEIVLFVPNFLRALGNFALRKTLPFIAVALVAVVCSGTRSTAQEESRRLDEGTLRPWVFEPSRNQRIPEFYDTYSLLLVCNPQWLGPERIGDLGKLYRQFGNFGRAIGNGHVAVWFWKNNAKASFDVAMGDAQSSKFANELDVERSVRFCKAWKLKPSAGPHLIVTSTYPSEFLGLPKDSAVYALGNMAPNEISALLAKLTDELVEKGHIDPDSPALWVRLLEATQHAINSFGCAWSFKVDAGPVNASLQSCKTR